MSPPGSEARHELRFLPSGRTVLVPDNANLREVCLREGVVLYFGLGRWFNCGGRARCASCVVRVVEGGSNLSAPTPPERQRLESPDPSLRLACQANVRGPVVVDVRG